MKKQFLYYGPDILAAAHSFHTSTDVTVINSSPAGQASGFLTRLPLTYDFTHIPTRHTALEECQVEPVLVHFNNFHTADFCP